MHSHPPPEDPTQQFAHALLAIRGRSDQEGRKRKAEYREDGGKRHPRKGYWYNGNWSVLREQQGKHAAPSERESHDQEGRYRVAGHHSPERGGGVGGLLVLGSCGHDRSPFWIGRSQIAVPGYKRTATRRPQGGWVIAPSVGHLLLPPPGQQ